jgi:FkbM family methyltransferase
MRDEEWLDTHVQHLLAKCGRRLAVDIGANFGTWSNFLKPLFDRVIAVEPDDRCPEITGTEFYRMVIGKTTGVCTLWLSNEPQQNHLGETHPLHGTGGQPLEITQQTFEQLCAERVPDFVKIDVEGAEDSILAGIANPAAYSKTAFLIESHAKQSELVAILSRWGREYIKIPHPAPCPDHCWIAVPALT